MPQSLTIQLTARELAFSAKHMASEDKTVEAIKLASATGLVFVWPPETGKPFYRTSAYDNQGNNTYMGHPDLPTALDWTQKFLAVTLGA